MAQIRLNCVQGKAFLTPLPPNPEAKIFYNHPNITSTQKPNLHTNAL